MFNQKLSRRNFVKLGSALSSLPFLPGFAALNSCGNPGKEATLDTYWQQFQNPPVNARPFVRWWWNGNRLDAGELVRELDIMKAAGIGGVEINPIAFPQGADPVGYESLTMFSPQWLEMLEVALKAAGERGIICDMIVGSGWPFGGEFLEKGEQSQLVTIETIDLEGEKTYNFNKQALLDKVNPPIHSPNNQVYKELIQARLMPAQADQLTTGQEVTDKLQDGKLTLEVPSGSHVLYYVVKLTGYMAVINGAPGAAGPVLNHYNQPAVEKYLQRVSNSITGKIGPMGSHIRAMFCDSMELEGANWNDDLPAEFAKRRGYDLWPYLPLVLQKVGHMGNPLDEQYGTQFTPEIATRLKRIELDYYQTRLELFKERFLQPFNQWCQSNGVQSRMQAYGRGMHPVEASMEIDIPECETWLNRAIGYDYPDRGLRGRGYTMSNKYVASGALLAGKKLVSCEEITNTSMVFMASLQDIKITGDQSNLSGVNHSILHGFNYSPPDAPFPGWIRYGTWFNERNPWWPFFRKWADYKTRLSCLFQNAVPKAEFAILPPLKDLWLRHGPQRDPFPRHQYPDYQHNLWEAVHQNGSGCDYISETILQNAVVESGRLSFNSRSYGAVLLPEIETLSRASAEKLVQFAQAGGKVFFIGTRPMQSPAYLQDEQKDKEVKILIDSMLKDHAEKVKLIPSPPSDLVGWFGKLMDENDLRPYIKFNSTHPFLNQVSFQLGDNEMFFLVNASQTEGITCSADFNLKQEKNAWIWDPETGSKQFFSDQNTQLPIYLPPATSMVLVFSAEKSNDYYRQLKPGLAKVKLDGPWKLELNHLNGERREVQMDNLQDLVERDDLKDFAGTIFYHRNFSISEADQLRQLELGRVHGVSEVELNNQNLGLKWYGQHIYPVGNTLKTGENDLKIKITTIAGNYLKSLTENETAQRWTSRQPATSMGLVGPVVLSAELSV